MSDYYIWPVAELSVAQAALDSLNNRAELPIVGRNAATGELAPDAQKTTKWADAVQTFVNGTVGFPRLSAALMDYLGVSEEDRQAWLTYFHPQILPYDPSWEPAPEE